MAAPAKVFTIPPGAAFVDALAEGLLAEHGGDPLALAAVTVLLPTRRAARALADAFLRLAGGGVMMLPAMRAIGDVDDEEVLLADGEVLAETLGGDDLPPAIPDLERQLLLAQLIRGWEGRYRGGPGPSTQAQAVRLAVELGRFLDQVQTARLTFDRLDELVTGELAAHWQETVRFLSIVTRHWPALLAARGAIDPAERRNRALAALAARWRAEPPATPVVAAGSTGSIPATAELLAVVAAMANGRVVLPGLDTGLDEASWQALDESHPQFGLKLLLERLALARADVAVWPHGAARSKAAAARAALVCEAMRPEATAERWRDLGHLDAAAVRGLRRIVCPEPQAEAGAIALMMREALEVRGRTAALVTADRALARRVRAELLRWGVGVDDSAGEPLADTVPGTFLALCLQVVAERAAPVPLLALLKHPLAAGGLAPAAFRARARRLERACLRGPRPAPGFAGLKRALRARARGQRDLTQWLDALARAARPLERVLARRRIDIARLAEAHLAFAEWLAGDESGGGAARLWAGEAGAAAAALFEQLIESTAGLAPIPGAEYPALVAGLVERVVVRARAGRHPRLFIWGPLEARLQHADLVVIGGLNEGTWPRAAAIDPWLSRPMRRAFGLPQPERMIGLAAYDFAELASAPEVVLTRSAKVDGTPTVPSRWLARIETVLAGAGLDGHLDEEAFWPAWQRLLDQPQGPPRPVPPPAPRPPVAARPRRLSVTRIERWMRDPYEIFARHVLALEALEPIDADIGVAEFGSYIHRALERFVAERAGGEPSLQRLLDIGAETLRPARAFPGLWAFWWPRFQRIAAWFVEVERARSADLVASATEVRGELDIAAPAGRFTLSAIADRIDRRKGGGLDIIDYKTGAAPSAREIAAGFAPQLPLEAAIARAGGFRGIAPAPVASLAHWRLAGREPPGEVIAVAEPPARLAEQALAGLAALIATFDDPATPYVARPAPGHAPRYSDYEHLARIGEWGAVERDEQW